MKRNIKFYYLIFIIFFLHFGCKKVVRNENIEKFVNNWKTTKKPVPFSGTLKINKNKTFEYYAGTCSSKSFSKGKWNVDKDTIILNSFESKECYFLEEFEINCISVSKKGKPLVVKKTIKNCEPKTEDSYVEFVNTKFYLNDTILIHKRNVKNNCQLNLENLIITLFF
ncbi:hypothetical protein [Flavobacterium sp.]|uniref:hypothetical protein n=1 Tax=Flavobacterium sp. TaxID=239 RepID=UPI00286DF8AA|nr:hypothetical protein [Flavobacterium sp.]